MIHQMVLQGAHSYMVQTALGDLLRLSRQKILEDVFPRCHRIVEIAQAGIDRGIFPDGSDVRQVLDVILTDARGH